MPTENKKPARFEDMLSQVREAVFFARAAGHEDQKYFTRNLKDLGREMARALGSMRAHPMETPPPPASIWGIPIIESPLMPDGLWAFSVNGQVLKVGRYREARAGDVGAFPNLPADE